MVISRFVLMMAGCFCEMGGMHLVTEGHPYYALLIVAGTALIFFGVFVHKIFTQESGGSDE